jgi:hypothetical protein
MSVPCILPSDMLGILFFCVSHDELPFKSVVEFSMLSGRGGQYLMGTQDSNRKLR